MDKLPKSRGNQTGWHLNTVIWRELENLLGDRAFAKVQFNTFMINTVTTEPGVYLLCSHPPLPTNTDLTDKLYNVLYVGQAGNLRSRMLDHLNGKNSHIKIDSLAFSKAGLAFWYITVPKDSLSEFEGKIQAAFNPVINRISAPSYRAKLSVSVSANPERLK